MKRYKPVPKVAAAGIAAAVVSILVYFGVIDKVDSREVVVALAAVIPVVVAYLKK